MSRVLSLGNLELTVARQGCSMVEINTRVENKQAFINYLIISRHIPEGLKKEEFHLYGCDTE